MGGQRGSDGVSAVVCLCCRSHAASAAIGYIYISRCISLSSQQARRLAGLPPRGSLYRRVLLLTTPPICLFAARSLAALASKEQKKVTPASLIEEEEEYEAPKKYKVGSVLLLLLVRCLPLLLSAKAPLV